MSFNKRKKDGSIAKITFIAAAVSVALASQANAFPLLPSGGDWVANWDQTVRLNLGVRATDIDKNGPASTATRDQSEYIFEKGDLVMKRLDWFSEFDLTYQGRMGIRVTGAAWFDDAYGSYGKSNPALAGQESYPNNRFSNYVKRYYHGPSGEFSDAFGWANFNVPSGLANIKIGRYSQLWGEAVGGTASANSVGVSMAPSDGQKSSVSPGATAKETLLPLSQIGMTVPLTEQLSLSALYTLEYRASRAAEGGTYFAGNDVSLHGPVVTYAGGVPLYRTDPVEGDKGDYGVMLRYSPEWLKGDTVSFIARRYDDKGLTYSNTSVPDRFFRYVANRDIKLYGLTYSTNIMRASVGAELSYRKGQGLAGGLNAATLVPARGDTLHGLVNVTKSFNQTSFWSTAALSTELSWVHLDKVTDNVNLYQGNTAACATRNIIAGCPTRNAYHLSVSFSPSWQQILPSVDLSMPISLLRGIKGNAPTSGGAINEGSGAFVVGLNSTIYSRYIVSLTYTNYLNQHRGTGATYVNNGGSANYDKDWIGLSFQTSF